jgi:hypothetical protein
MVVQGLDLLLLYFVQSHIDWPPVYSQLMLNIVAVYFIWLLSVCPHKRPAFDHHEAKCEDRAKTRLDS